MSQAQNFATQIVPLPTIAETTTETPDFLSTPEIIPPII